MFEKEMRVYEGSRAVKRSPEKYRGVQDSPGTCRGIQRSLQEGLECHFLGYMKDLKSQGSQRESKRVYGGSRALSGVLRSTESRGVMRVTF